MLQTDAINRLRVDLSDTDRNLFTNDDVLIRSIQRAVADLSRYLPLDKILEVTLIFTVTDEAWTSEAAAGTYVALVNKPVKHGSEVVKNAAGTACVRDTDYTIDYTNGKITHISSGAIGNGEACTISYTKSEVIVDISSLMSDLIRVDRVEYPIGKIPQAFVPYEVWEDLLTVKSGALETYTAMTEKDHVGIHYKAKHTAPTLEAEGSYPSFLDDTVILGASAYAIFSLGTSYFNQVVTDLASARTALGSVTAIHAKVTTALDSAKTALAAATSALASGNVDDFLSGASAPSVKKYLTDGSLKINEVTKGVNVAERYASYAQRSAELALTFIQKASEHNTNAGGYNTEATQRIAEIDRHIGEADRYTSLAVQNLALADKLRTEAIERRNEAWAIYRDPSQYSGQLAISPATQAKE